LETLLKSYLDKEANMDQQDGISSFPTPKNINDIKKIYQQYGHFLSPENQQLLMDLIKEVEQGNDPRNLQKIASRVQNAAGVANDNFNMEAQANNLQNTPPINNEAPLPPQPKRQQGGNPHLSSRQQSQQPAREINHSQARQQPGRASIPKARLQPKGTPSPARGKDR